MYTYLFTHLVSQNYVYFRIQWFFRERLIQKSMIFPWVFHFYKFQELIMKFNDFSMIWKFLMIFQWYLKTKIPNFHDNSEHYKPEKHRTTCFAWSHCTSYDHYWVSVRKSVKSSYFIWSETTISIPVLHLMNSISMNNVYIFIHSVS